MGAPPWTTLPSLAVFSLTSRHRLLAEVLIGIMSDVASGHHCGPGRTAPRSAFPTRISPRSEESPAYQHFRELLADQGFTLNWQSTYNAGANPISIRLRRRDLRQPAGSPCSGPAMRR